MSAIERHRRNATAHAELLGIDLRAYGAVILIPMIWQIVGIWAALIICGSIVAAFAVASKFGITVGVLYLKLRHKLRGNNLDCEGYFYWKEFRNRR